MATGYTYPLLDNDVPFEDFVLACARAMSPFIMQRDDDAGDLPKKIDERSHAEKTLAEYRGEKKWWTELTDDQRYAEYIKYAEKTAADNAASMKKAAEVRERLEKMLVQVKTWKIDPVLENFRTFMIQQLESTIEWDGKGYTTEIQSFDEWNQGKYNFYERMVSTYVGEVAKEKERVAFQHNYTDLLYKALGKDYNEQ